MVVEIRCLIWVLAKTVRSIVGIIYIINFACRIFQIFRQSERKLFISTFTSRFCDKFIINTTDGLVLGFSADSDKTVYTEYIPEYMDLEYVDTPSTKENTILSSISKHLKE